MERLEDLDSKRLKVATDAFKVRCFHLAYKLLASERMGPDERFVIAVATTSDMQLNFKEEKTWEGFKEWYYTYFITNKAGRGVGRKYGKRKKMRELISEGITSYEVSQS